MRTYFVGLFIAMCIGISLSAKAAGPALADRIPADAIVYIGWAGSDALFPAYDASRLKNIVQASDMPTLFDAFMPQLIKRVAREDKDSAEILRQVAAIGAPVWKHPTAFYFGGIDWHGPQPMPHLAVLCDAGSDAPALAQRITKLLASVPKEQGPIPLVKTYGSMVVFAFGTPASIDADFAQSPVSNIGNAAKFKAALSQVQKNPAYVEFIDADAGVKMIDDAMAKMNQPPITTKWEHARDALGLTGLHQIIVTASFEGRGWGDEVFISHGQGSKGVLALINATPLSTDLLKVVPQSADDMMAGKLDLDVIVGELHDIIAEFDQSSADQLDDAIAKVNQVAGLDLRKDLLANLGSEWVFYSDPTVGGPGFMGSVVVNKLKDADAVDKAMAQLAQRANAIVASQMHDAEVKIEFHESIVNGVTLHYLAVPFVTPCWAIKNGCLFAGLYPQVVSAAVEQVTAKAPSILQRTEYSAVMKQLGDHQACSVAFSNLPSTAREGYTGVLAFSRMYLGIADIMGIQVPAMVIPPLSKITPELTPCGSVSWSDATGFHVKSTSPFPGSQMFAGSSLGSSLVLGEGSMMVSILLPSLNRARETANRAKCASNLHQIGLGLLLYSNDNNQKMPDTLGDLVKSTQLAPAVFICPSGNNELPPNATAMTPDEQAAWVNDHSDYLYLGKGLKTDQIDATRVVVYEKDGAHESEGMNILYGDGHVEWKPRATALQEIQAAKQGK